MRPRLPAAAFLAAALVACGGGPTATSPNDPGADAGEPAGLASITSAHNQVRAAVGVGPLTWDAALARTAAAWAARCVDEDRDGMVDHNPDRSAGSSVYVGENIYASTAGLDGVTGPDAVRAWASEASSYDYATNSCAAGRVCGHYTQLVWAATTRVGCAKVRCAALTYATNVVCDYAPGGNVSGQRPY